MSGFALCSALLTVLASSGVKPVLQMSFPQLIASKYGTSKTTPPEGHRPSVETVFVNRSLLPANATIQSAARSASGIVWVVTNSGAYQQKGSECTPLASPSVSLATQLPIQAGTRINHVTSDKLGHIWAATTSGVYITDGADWWERLDRKDGVPYDDVNVVFLAANGDVWGGTNEGAWRLRDGKFRYFWGKRWLPGNHVAAIWGDSKGRTWFETNEGVGSIEEQKMTLAEKAAHYDAITQERHNRRGYIGLTHLKVPGEPTAGANYEAADSDGLWTSYYVAAMAFRYAATHSAQAREEARRSMNAMLELERLSGIPGYPARCAITEQEIKDGILGFNPDAPVHVPGDPAKYWVKSPVEPGVWLKTDTSSDTMDGHFFAWFLYHDLVADAAEKKKIEAIVRRAVDYIIEHGYTLIGHSGRVTRWGMWAPQSLNFDPYWSEQRGLNSMEILSHLKMAFHITGDQKYQRAYEELIQKHHYLQNTLLIRRGSLVDWWEINHSDDQLMTIGYYPLLMLEKNPDYRRILLQSLARTWENSVNGEQTQRAEHSSFYNFAYGAMSGSACDADDGIADLQDWPWDLVDWTIHNSQRHDVKILQHPNVDWEYKSHLDRVVPSSERYVKRWNGNPWQGDAGNDGKLEQDGSTWLIGYWMGVYHGYIKPNQ